MDIDLIINTDETAELDQLKDIVRDLRKQSHQVQARVTFEGVDATHFAREATLRGADLIIAAGGDGTVNKVLNGMLAPGHSTPSSAVPRLAIVPLGTANDLAGFLDIPPTIPDAMAVAVEGAEIEADVACLNGRYFVNVSTGGLGAEATEEASDKAKKLLGTVAYFVTGVRKFASLRPSCARFESNGDLLFDGDFLFFAVGNGARTGGGNLVTPNADLSDGQLDLCIVEAMSHADFLRILPDLRTGQHLRSPLVHYHRITELTVRPEGDLSVNVDGEPIDDRVFDYTIHSRALRLAVPAPPR